MVIAGFEGDIGGGAAGSFTGEAQRMDLGVRFAGALVPAFADDGTIAHDDAADARIGCRRVQPARRQLQGAGHEPVVGGAEGGGHDGASEGSSANALRRTQAGLRRTRGFFTSRIASENSSTSSKLRYTEAKRM